MIIPHQQLSREAVQGLIETFVTQQGMDQFDTRYTLEEKANQVMDMLISGLAVIVFDPITESCNIVTKEAAKSMPDNLPTGDEF